MTASDPNNHSAPNREDEFRRATRNMTWYPIPKMQWCPCCRKHRTHVQFTEGKKFCNYCRRKR